MAGNMESMLLNGDWSSSDDSSENNEKPREQEPAATAGRDTAEPRPPAPGPASKRRRLSSPGSAFERITPSTSARTQLPQSGSCIPSVEAQTPTKRTSRPPLLPQESFWNATTRSATTARSTTTPRSIATPDRAQSKSELKLFTKYLLHSLAQQDPALHRRANGLIQEFNQKAASRKESPGYRNRMDEYRIQLKAIVGDAHWSRAEALTKAHLQRGENQKNNKAAQGMASTKARAASSTSLDASTQVENEERDNNIDTMVMVDHAVDYDWSSPLLGKKADLKLTREQTVLLYGRKPEPATTYPFLASGWSKRNILNARRAWATARLRLAAQDQYVARLINRVPVVAGLPSSPQLTRPPPKVPPLPLQLLWVNEQNAENDPTLALLSEATQIYLKSILQKALTIARERENINGFRLVHLQHGPKKPPMSLRLGCDVTRQVAQVAGNAAKTVQRMEEALGRQPNVRSSDCDLSNYETLYQASSMADLSLRPQLANAAEQAALIAKRSFEIYEGNDATGPPFGPIPKRPKILSSDVTLAYREYCDYGHQRLHCATPQIQL